MFVRIIKKNSHLLLHVPAGGNFSCVCVCAATGGAGGSLLGGISPSAGGW